MKHLKIEFEYIQKYIYIYIEKSIHCHISRSNVIPDQLTHVNQTQAQVCVCNLNHWSMHPIGFQLLIIGQKGMIDVPVLKNTNRQLNFSILCTQEPLSEKHSRFILTQTHTTLKESDILDCPLHVDLQCSLIKKIFLSASPCVWWCYGGFIQRMAPNKKYQEHTEQQISPWA